MSYPEPHFYKEDRERIMKRMKDIMAVTTTIVLVFIVVFGIAYGTWYVKRWFNYKLGYSGQVQVQVDKTMQDHINKYHKDNK